ncbi:multiheme c-type cytochrome [Chitinophaga barathri]|uniref:Cytochrome c-552/4 domain-containing protein n=1 Tax=Chitinophaga barathri TaxID=1647451 RepID=A0A3N4N336_9BACT|nr:multiheme c-type cytochrome [Chitinophaga barathri]RPD42023.1 hypothetical protein EG028_07685 [Chitinophaga barathri]
MNKRQAFVCGFIISCVIVLSRCIGTGPEKKETDLRGEQYASQASCATCHKTVYDAYLNTAHHNTSAEANAQTVMGSFTAPGNIYHYTDDKTVVMEKRDSGLYQSGYDKDTLRETHRFDIAIGSGKKAQTFLYWNDGKFFQLPVSYLVGAHQWANSPGFPPTHPKFDRVIPSACFGCHTSSVGIKEAEIKGLQVTETFHKNQTVYGIDCQRCHGPAAAHVDYHTEHPREKQARHITRIRALANQQRLDQCALCHSGLSTAQQSVFDFKPGDDLTDYFLPEIGTPAKATSLDVHGNQYQLFTASKCFIQSREMNCSNCHNPHTRETGNMQMFSQRCMNCHQAGGANFCTLKTLPVATLSQNCVDCHMPALPSNAITLLTNGAANPTPDSIRTHLITIYPEETERIISMLKKQ